MAVLILLQLGLIIGVMVSLSGFKLVSDLLRFINFFLIIYIVNKQENPSYKLAWIILVLVFPAVWGLVLSDVRRSENAEGAAAQAVIEAARTHPVPPRNEKILEEIEAQDEQIAKQFRYVVNNAYYPVYKNTEATYCPGPGKLSSGICWRNKKPSGISSWVFYYRQRNHVGFDPGNSD